MARLNPHLPVRTGPTYRIVVQGLLFGQTTINTHYMVDVNQANPVMQGTSLAVYAQDWWAINGTAYRAVMTADWALVAVRVYVMNNAAISPGVYLPAAGTILGTHASGGDTSWVAAGCLRHTSYGGQRGQGAFRIPAVPLSDVVGNSFTPAYKILLLALFTALLTTVPSSINPGVSTVSALARIETMALPLNTVEAAIISNYSIQQYSSSQLTRRPRPVN